MPRVLNYQGSEYASSSEYARVLNVKDLWLCFGFWICHSFEYPRVMNVSQDYEYASGSEWPEFWI